jgi:DNA-binding transcriptional ArsR family regulator
MTAEQRLDATFAALADPTRRAILARLAEPFAMSQPAVSKHLKVLERAGLITRSRDAQRRPCRLEAQALGAATAWLARYRKYWERQYRNLDDLLDRLQREPKTTEKPRRPARRRT